MRIRPLISFVTAVCVAAAAMQPGLVLRAVQAQRATSAVVTLSGQTPALVQQGRAAVLSVRPPADPLAINISLPLRNEAQLNAFIADEASHGVYLSNDTFMAQYAPTPDQVQAVRTWAATHGMSVISVSSNNTLITLQASTGTIETALGMQIKNYRAPDGTQFYANDRDVTVPASLGIQAISGLTNLHRFHLNTKIGARLQPGATPDLLYGTYGSSDLRAAYDVAGHGYDGTGQTIGFTLWGQAVSNSDLYWYSRYTGDVQMSAGTGPDQIQWLYCASTNSGCSTTQPSNALYTTDALMETALDVEVAHGMATHAHLKYFLSDETQCTGSGTSLSCQPTDVGLEKAVAAAAADPTISVISNSWDGNEAVSTNDPFVLSLETSFKQAVARGATFYFASGDSGSLSGGSSGSQGLPAYPADSPQVVSVGGTTLTTNSSSQYVSETAWNGSGGGCSAVFARPSWQTGVAAASCPGRAEPDVAADADPNTGAFVFVQGGAWEVGGTSLATPIWAGMTAVANRYAAQTGGTPVGWAAPKIYTLANSSSYATTYHDVTSGNNIQSGFGFSAGQGWDEVTGWGSVDWWKWAQAITSNSGTPAVSTATPTNTSTPSNTPIPSSTPSNTPIPSSTPSNTPIPSSTPSNTPIPSSTPSNTPIPSSTPSNTPIPSSTPSNTPIPSSTPTNTPIPSSTPIPTNTPAGAPTPSNAVINGGFEAGTLAGWQMAITQLAGMTVPAPQITSARVHSGAYAAQLGGSTGPWWDTPHGDSCLYQNINLSGTHTLSFYDFETVVGLVSSRTSWVEAYYRPYGTTGCAEIGTPLFQVAQNGSIWNARSFTVNGPGQIYFNVHQTGFYSVTTLYVDDVSIH